METWLKKHDDTFTSSRIMLKEGLAACLLWRFRIKPWLWITMLPLMSSGTCGILVLFLSQDCQRSTVIEIDVFQLSSGWAQLNIIDESSAFQHELQMNFMRTLSNENPRQIWLRVQLMANVLVLCLMFIVNLSSTSRYAPELTGWDRVLLDKPFVTVFRLHRIARSSTAMFTDLLLVCCLANATCAVTNIVTALIFIILIVSWSHAFFLVVPVRSFLHVLVAVAAISCFRHHSIWLASFHLEWQDSICFPGIWNR